MKHGYTNDTRRSGEAVHKTYQGPDAANRQAAEQLALSRLGGAVPLPGVIASGPGWLDLEFISGRHGQELLDDGSEVAVLYECGRVLRALHELDPRTIDSTAPSNVVIQHGDFGPNNVLFDADAHIIAVLDWEFCTVGAPIADIAWCEWIVRMHHPAVADAMRHFFSAYGSIPPWQERQAEMIRRCRWLQDFTARWDPNGLGVAVWQERASVVESWNE